MRIKNKKIDELLTTNGTAEMHNVIIDSFSALKDGKNIEFQKIHPVPTSVVSEAPLSYKQVKQRRKQKTRVQFKNNKLLSCKQIWMTEING